MSEFESDVKAGKRFEFGKNWMAFLKALNDDRIEIAKASVIELLDVEDLKGKKFLDVGSGSGLFSLVSRMMGAQVRSFDYDPQSVACTKELRSRYFPNDQSWHVEQGSVLDKEYLNSLGHFDVVYSWGVLHHTGNMWEAIENAASLVAENGIFCIAIYNDEGIKSKLWRKIKEIYCSSFLGRSLVISIFCSYYTFKNILISIYKRENVFYTYRKNRGMSMFYDWLDWLGGLPFEVASIEAIFLFMRRRGFVLTNIKDTNGLGCNQFVFTKM